MAGQVINGGGSKEPIYLSNRKDPRLQNFILKIAQRTGKEIKEVTDEEIKNQIINEAILKIAQKAGKPTKKVTNKEIKDYLAEEAIHIGI